MKSITGKVFPKEKLNIFRAATILFRSEALKVARKGSCFFSMHYIWELKYLG